LIRSGGSWEIDRALWDRDIAPLWKAYLPKDLTVRRYRGYGTRAKPYTTYTMNVVHKDYGVVYDGNSQLLFDISTPEGSGADSQRSDAL
jgi:hypothetical protein